jgi:hypothetical protein
MRRERVGTSVKDSLQHHFAVRQSRAHENELADHLDELGEIFGFAPSPLLSLAPGFRQGDALFAAGFGRSL